MPHLDNVILPASTLDPAGVLFPIPYRATRGKPIVCMYPEVKQRRIDGTDIVIEIPEEVASKYQPDWGVVASVHPDDTWEFGLEVGHIVAVKPYTGAEFAHGDQDWPGIPKDRLVRVLGTVDHWMSNILTTVELEGCGAKVAA